MRPSAEIREWPPVTGVNASDAASYLNAVYPPSVSVRESPSGVRAPGRVARGGDEIRKGRSFRQSCGSARRPLAEWSAGFRKYPDSPR